MLKGGNLMKASQNYKTYGMLHFLKERKIIPALFFDDVLLYYPFRCHGSLYPPVVGVGQKCNFPS